MSWEKKVYNLQSCPVSVFLLYLFSTEHSKFNYPTPTITAGPQDITAFPDDHADLYFNCSTQHTNKWVTWYFKPARSSSGWTLLSSIDTAAVSSGQALRFPANKKLLESYEGFYRCAADSPGIGTIISRPARLTLACMSIGVSLFCLAVILPWFSANAVFKLVSNCLSTKADTQQSREI